MSVVVPPRAACWPNVRDLFPEATQLLGAAGTGVVRVRDTSARLYGYYFVETEGSRTIPVCHLIGG